MARSIVKKSGNDPQTSAPAIAEAVRFGRRTKFNPISNLSAASLTRALESFDRGDLREAALMWDSMSTRDDTIPSVKAKREKSVAHKRLETVTLEKSPAADQHRDVLKAFWENARYVSAWDRSDAGGVQKLIRSMQTAVSYRYAMHHIVWRPSKDGLRATFEAVPLWFFECREARMRFLPSGYGYDGIELDASEWLTSYGDGLMVAASIGYFCKRAVLQDWLRFSEKFAMPGVLGKTSAAQGTPEGDAMRSAVETFGNEWAAVLYGFDGANTAGIELIQANGNPAAMPMPALIERVDKKIAALYRGADLSTMSSGSGSEGTGASLQGEEQDILERADAAERSEELQRVERTVIEWHFGRGVEPLAKTELIVPEREDQRLMLEATKTFVDLGARISVRESMERFGISEADEEEVVLRSQESAVSSQEEGTTGEKLPAANAWPDDLAPKMTEKIAAILMQGLDEAIDAGNETDEPEDGTASNADATDGSRDELRDHGSAPNAVAISVDAADGWYQIAPYGEWPTVDGKYIQVFGPEQAQAMVRNYNSIPFRLSRWLFSNEVPVFIGHPDVDRKAWPDERRLAKKHAKLEAREDGLWGQAAWNALGNENLTEGYWNYPSPVWLFPKPKPGTNRVFPDVLQSVGLTNFQNTPDARRLTHNAQTTESENDMNLLERLKALLGIDPEATEDAIFSVIEELKTKATPVEGVAEENATPEVTADAEAMKAELAEEKTKREAAENALQVHRTTAANAMLDVAIEAGALTLAERPGWEQRFATDYEAAANALADVKPVLNKQGLDLSDAKPAVAPETPAERIRAVNAAVAAETERNGGDYDTAYQTVKKDPKMKHIFDAMKSQ